MLVFSCVNSTTSLGRGELFVEVLFPSLFRRSKSEISSPDAPISPSPPRASAVTASQLLLQKKQANDLSYLSDPRPSSSPTNQKILVEYAHRRTLLPSPVAGSLPVQVKPNDNKPTTQDASRPGQRTLNFDQNHRSPVPQRDGRRLYERRPSTDQRSFHSRPPPRPEERRPSLDFRSSKGGTRGGGRGGGGGGETNSQNSRRSGQRHQAGWGASLEGDDRVFGYQHDKIDYLSLPRPVKKAPPKVSKDSKGQIKSDGSPLKQLAAALKDNNDDSTTHVPNQQNNVQDQTEMVLVDPRIADARPPVGRLASTAAAAGAALGLRTGNRTGAGRADLEIGPGSGSDASRFDGGLGPGEGNGGVVTHDSLEQNVVSVEISELEEGGPADDPMLGQYFDTSSSFIVKDISAEEETPLPIIEIGETDTDLWTDAAILDIDDG